MAEELTVTVITNYDAEADEVQSRRSKFSRNPSHNVRGRSFLLIFLLLITMCVGTTEFLCSVSFNEVKLTNASIETGNVITCYSETRQSSNWDGKFLQENATQTTSTTLIVLGSDTKSIDFGVVFGELTIDKKEKAEAKYTEGEVDLLPIAMVQVNKTNGEIVEVAVTESVQSHTLEDGLRLVRQVALKPEDYSQLYAKESNTECRHSAVFAQQRFCPTVSHSSTDLHNIYRSHYSDESNVNRRLTDETTRFNITEDVEINKETEAIERSFATVLISREVHWTASNISMHETAKTIATDFVLNTINPNLLSELQKWFFSANYSSVSIENPDSVPSVKRELMTNAKKVKIFDLFGTTMYLVSNLQVSNQAKMDKSIEFAGKNVFLTSQTFGEEVRIGIGKLAALKKAINASSVDMLKSITDFGDYLDRTLPVGIDAKVGDIRRFENQLKSKSQPLEASVLNLITSLSIDLQTLRTEKLFNLTTEAKRLNTEIEDSKSSNKDTSTEERELKAIQTQIYQINSETYSFDRMGYDNVSYVLVPLINQITDIKKDLSEIESIATNLANEISQDFATFSNNYKSYAAAMKRNFESIVRFQPVHFSEISTNIFSYAFFEKQIKSIKSDLYTFSESVPAFNNVNSTVTQLDTALKSDIQETVWTSAFDSIKSRLEEVLEPYHINSVTLNTIDSMKSDFVASLGQPMEPLVKCLSSECAKPINFASLSTAHSDLDAANEMKTTKVNDFLRQYMKKTEPIVLAQKTEHFAISNIGTPIRPTQLDIVGTFNISQYTVVELVTDKSFTETLKTIVDFRLEGSFYEEVNGIRSKLFAGVEGKFELSSVLEYFSIISKITGKEEISMLYTGKYDGKTSHYTQVGIGVTRWKIRIGRVIIQLCVYAPIYNWSEYVLFAKRTIAGMENLQLEGFKP